MAQTVHLKLQIDGNDLSGESTIRSMEREDTIECSGFTCGLEVGRDMSGQITDKKRYEHVTITKRIDRTTPLILKALCYNEPVTRAEFRFYRPSSGSSGAEEHFYTILLENGFISSVQQMSSDSIIGGEDAPPMMEEISIFFQDITWTYEIGGATHKDSWKL